MLNEAFMRSNIAGMSGDIAIDVGACHGGYTRVLSENFRQVVAFEPHPANVAIMDSPSGVPNMVYQNVTVLPKALGDRLTSVKLYTHERNPSMHTIVELAARVGYWQHSIDRFIEVEMTTIDEEFGPFGDFSTGKVDLIKLNAEGAEHLVIKGALETLKKDFPVIMLQTRITTDIASLYKLLNDAGYAIYDPTCTRVFSISRDSNYRCQHS